MKLFPSAKYSLITTAAIAGLVSFAAAAADSSAPAAPAAPAARPATTAMPAAGDTLKIGDAAPDGKGVDQNNKAVELAPLYKKGIVLVYFYPKAGTKGCTDEACSLRDAYADLTGANLTVVGISHDTVAEQKKFADDNKLPFSLVADTAGDICKAFNVPGSNRQTFLVKDGKIVYLELTNTATKDAADHVKAQLVKLNVMKAPEAPKPLGTAPAAKPATAATPAPKA